MKDPLHKPGIEQELFKEIGRILNGASLDVVKNVAVNMLVNALRQQNASKRLAEQSFDELAARAKGLLLDQHYDMTGNRRNVFPFHQVIHIDHYNARKH